MNSINKTDDLINKINAQIEQLDFSPENKTQNFFCHEIAQAHKYPLCAGGKRIRPLLTLLMAGVLNGESGVENAMDCALAVELIHTYSLVHDDLPSMDNDALRRGKPTSHVVYGEAKALLIGDGLLTEAFQVALRNPKQHSGAIAQSLSLGSGPRGMIYGQWLDLSFTGAKELTWEQLEHIHTYKTGYLIGTSLELGFLCGCENSHLKNLEK
ncbi:MAG: polyprenyl synthetase family protein [Silvanigrellaceae bacterium]|nr:polyprenyl synthetase family protein [Silvanigrellaceae bacterium]